MRLLGALPPSRRCKWYVRSYELWSAAYELRRPIRLVPRRGTCSNSQQCPLPSLWCSKNAFDLQLSGNSMRISKQSSLDEWHLLRMRALFPYPYVFLWWYPLAISSCPSARMGGACTVEWL